MAEAMFTVPPSRVRWGAVLAAALCVMGFSAQAQESAPPLVDPNTPLPPGDALAITAIQRDISEIKSDMQILQETLDLIVNRMMADLEKENAQLREELRRLQEMGPMYSPGQEEGGGFVPRPGAALFEEVAQGPVPMESAEPVPFAWEVIAEWGREPAAAARLGASSLKGMVIVVPRGSAREDVEGLGRTLRSEFGDYDNINIEIFDDIAAAESYASTQVADPQHRILSVSKHQASGRDKILYLGGGENAHEVAPPENLTSPANLAPPGPAKKASPASIGGPVEASPTAPPLEAAAH